MILCSCNYRWLRVECTPSQRAADAMVNTVFGSSRHRVVNTYTYGTMRCITRSYNKYTVEHDYNLYVHPTSWVPNPNGRGTPNCFAVDCFTEQTWIILSISQMCFLYSPRHFFGQQTSTPIFIT